MELIGSNLDSSGIYRMYLDGNALVTLNGPTEDTLEETARQTLVPAPTFTVEDEDDWYTYGTGGHTCDVHFEGEHARIDGETYELVDTDPFHN